MAEPYVVRKRWLVLEKGKKILDHEQKMKNELTQKQHHSLDQEMTHILPTDEEIKSMEAEICQLEKFHPSVEEPMPSFTNMDPEDDTCRNLIIPRDQTVVHSWVLCSEVLLCSFEFMEFAKSLCTSQGPCHVELCWK